MRKILFICIFALYNHLAFCQNYSQFSFSLNNPLRATKDAPIRRLGLEAGYSKGFEINEKLAFETGLTLDFWGRFKYSVTEYNMVSSNFYHSAYYCWHFGFNVPLLMNIRMNKFEIKNGINLSLKNFITLTNYTSLDPDLGFATVTISPPAFIEENSRFFGVSYQFNISYYLNDRLSPFLDLKSLMFSLSNVKSDGPNYSLVNIGMRYRLGKN